MMRSFSVLLALGLSLPACDCGGSPGGDDGDGGTPGADANCDTGFFPGCACDPATADVQPCYEGPSGTSGNPPCMKGTMSCQAATSTWGPCEGQVLPEPEACDKADNDCDGDADEEGCQGVSVGDDPFELPPPGGSSDGVGLDPNGDLVLDSDTYENNFIWIANDPQGTVSKIDTRTGKEVGRYPSVSHEVLINASAGVGVVPTWAASGSNLRPSRTTIDGNYDMWVANRSHDAGDGSTTQQSITKIRNLIDDCVDRNAPAGIQTSNDANNDGVININDPLEFFGEADECIAMTVAVGIPGSIARALAIDKGIDPSDPGNVWVGMWGGNNGERAFFQINGTTGSLMQRVPPVAAGNLPSSPYGAAIDGQGRLWAAYSCCGATVTLLRIETYLNPATYNPSIVIGGVDSSYVGGTYGITVDTEDRVWIGGWTQGRMKRYDPATGGVLDAFIDGSSRLRGVGIDSHGNVWGAIDCPANNCGLTGQVTRVTADTATQTGVWNMNGVGWYGASGSAQIPVGVGVDFDGDVWTVNQSTSSASRMHIDQTTLQPAAHPTTGNIVDVFPTGPNPYTYSDFTGLGLRIVTDPQGDYVVPIEGCPEGEQATWRFVEWEATTPPNTAVEIWARSGDDLATLGSQPIFGAWTMSPANLQMSPGPVPPGRYLQLTIRLLSSDGESTPIVHSYEVQWTCPGDPIP